MSWCIPIIGAAITASATVTVFIMNKYFSVRAHLPTTADALLNTLHTAIAHTAQIAQGGNVHGRRHVTTDEFHAFRAHLWFWQMHKVSRLWDACQQTQSSPKEHLHALTNLQTEVKRLLRH